MTDSNFCDDYFTGQPMRRQGDGDGQPIRANCNHPIIGTQGPAFQIK